MRLRRCPGGTSRVALRTRRPRCPRRAFGGSRRPIALAAGTAALLLLLAGCGGNGQDTLSPHSTQAGQIANLFWVMMAVAWGGLLLVVALLFAAWKRRQTRGGDRFGTWMVGGAGIAMPIGVVAALFFFSDVFLIRDTQAPAASETRLTVTVIGHQWFWEARYPGTRAVVADEIHIPTRTPVNLQVRTVDVIHSFWVPELNRKIDVIPGRTNRILLETDRPGTYRGQCAEFCGLQHAHMAFLLIAQPPAQFRAWLARQAKPARRPTTAAQRDGRRVFLEGPCASCHTLRGTPADGVVGPDLTHLASRSTLAGLVLPNRKGYLAGWIVDSQHIKPGNQMPDVQLSGPQLTDLLAYLESLR